jgi:GH25 family lysozyme M1 (1,4-beta-N-acetylmuramidase)
MKKHVDDFILACHEEALNKHGIDVLDSDYNDDYHLELTVTVKELREAFRHIKHTHKASEEDPETCGKCGRNIGNLIHTRVKESP